MTPWLGALVIGVVVAVDPAGWYPFGPLRWMVTSVAACAVVAVSARRDRSRGVFHPHWLWAALLGWAALCAALGLEGLYAWTGTPERHLGVLSWVLFAAMYRAGATAVGQERRRLVQLGAAACGLIGLWSIVEQWRRPIAVGVTTDRWLGPFGSAAYLGAACCLFVPCALGLAVSRSASRRLRILAMLAAGAGTVGLVGSGARAAWVGCAASVLIVLAARRVRRRGVAAVAICVVTGLAVVGTRLDDVPQRPHETASRLDEWRQALRVVADRPLLGAGPEGYRLAFPAVVDASYVRAYGRDTMTDRAHNGPLDVAVTLGIPGLTLWLALMLFVARRAWRAMRGGPTDSAVLAAAWCAYAVQQLFLFPVPELDVVAWLFAGAICASAERRPAVAGAAARRCHPLIQWATVALALVLFVSGVLDVSADRLAKSSVTAHGSASSVTAARRAVRFRPDTLRYRLLLAEAERRVGTLASTERAISAAADAVRLSPLDPIARVRHAQLLSERAAITGASADVGAALDGWRVLACADPHNPAVLVGLARGYAAAEQADEARAAASAALALRPFDAEVAALAAALGALSDADGTDFRPEGCT